MRDTGLCDTKLDPKLKNKAPPFFERKDRAMSNQNLACRIFKEQIDLVMQLPRKEAAEVLYQAILSSLNQIENQIENQNENAYVSDSVSVSVSISVLGRTILKLLEKKLQKSMKIHLA